MIPRTLREQIADELEMLANELRGAKVEGDEAHAGLWLTSLDDRLDDLIGEHSAAILSRQYQEERVESLKVVDLAVYRN